MKKIIRWLTENNIPFEIIKDALGKERICITLEKDCVWVNGFGEEMPYDRQITISQDTYKKYAVYERIEYMRYNKLYLGTRADDAIKALNERFADVK